MSDDILNISPTEAVRIVGDDGGLRQSVSMRSGQLHGPTESYDEYGRLLQRAAYSDGQRHGSSEYHFNDRLQMKNG